MKQEFQRVYVLDAGSLLKDGRESVAANMIVVLTTMDDGEDSRFPLGLKFGDGASKLL